MPIDHRPGDWFHGAWEAHIDPIGVTLSFRRLNQPAIIPNFDYTKPDILIVGGWHHPGNSEKEIIAFLDQLEDLRRVHADGEDGDYGDEDHNSNNLSHTLVVQALPNHFPGGKYIKTGYPEAKVTIWNETTTFSEDTTVMHANRACDTHAESSGGDPDINDPLEKWVEGRQSMSILHVHHLYRDRGDAHIGFIPSSDKIPGMKGRDCLHWCVAPGVLDALAMETLSAIHQLLE